MRSIPLVGRVVSRLTGKSPGQVVVMFMLLSGVAGFAGVLTLDVGFWLAERRDAQGDADAIALAGAIELPIFDDELPDGATQENYVAPIALAAAASWATANGVDPDTELELTMLWNNDDSSDDECFAGQGGSQALYTGVRATVTRTAPSIFIGLISSAANIEDLTEVSVSAAACTGVPVEAIGFLPWVMTMDGDCFDDDGQPKWGERCILIAGPSGGSNGNFGLLSFSTTATGCPGDTGDNGVPGYITNLTNTMDFVCGVGDVVSSKPGLTANATLTGIQGRFAAYYGSGPPEVWSEPCDAAFSGDQDDLNAGATTLTVAGLTALAGFTEPLDGNTPGDGDGIDDFFEIWALPPGYDTSSPAEDLALRDCDPNADGVQGSPRSITTFLISSLDDNDEDGCGPGGCYEVQALAGIYLEGCSDTNQLEVVKDFFACSGTGWLRIYGRIVSVIGDTQLNLGFEEFGSWQTFLKE